MHYPFFHTLVKSFHFSAVHGPRATLTTTTPLKFDQCLLIISLLQLVILTQKPASLLYSQEMMQRICFVLTALFLLRFGVSQLPPNQLTTMASLYDMVRRDAGNSSFPWQAVSRDSNPCTWDGVSCSSDNSSVAKLSLPWFSISSSDILPLFCQLEALEVLDVSNNHLSSIPDGFISGSGCGLVKTLNLSTNKLAGNLPDFGGFKVLEVLDLSSNSLSGNISMQLRGLDSLKSLNLSGNQFTGSVPTNLGLFLLEELQISNNKLQGEFPSALLSYGNLSLIDLSQNNLSGQIPDRLSEFSRLQVLILSANNFTGLIPSSLSSLQTLSRFAAYENGFTGNIPDGITTYLTSLDLSYNQLDGIIPQNLLSQPKLQSIDLSYNLLRGPIPANISSGITRLRLRGNALNGAIPPGSLGSLAELMYLELDSNNLTGTIPPELGLCTNLNLLNLAQNQLSGVLPAQLGSLTKLQGMYLQQNRLVGAIPDQFTQLQKLLQMNISSNLINGSIPNSVSRMQNLTNLNLRDNLLSGSIPSSIGALSSLMELQLGNNQLRGDIPIMPTSLQIALNLSHNLFEGPIPASFNTLAALEVLDLSDNEFSGVIPNFLARMPGLTQVILSNNQLSGDVPDFGTHVTVITGGNAGLRNRSSENPTPTNPASAKRKKTVSVGVILGVAVAAAAASGLVTLIAISLSRRFYRISDAHEQPEAALSEQHIIQKKLLTPNPIHKSNIDLVKSMKSILPSNIFLKTKFSTYYKAIMPSGASYLIKKLNWSDKIFQLGNHEKFGKELDVLGKLSNSNVMIPLAYVLTADSAYVFYDFLPKGTLFDVIHCSSGSTLNWGSRYSISIGLAQGLAFLQSGSVLLLDLSSKSILLKSLNEPQIGDIELCQVIDPSKSTASLSTVAGTVGYIPPEYAYTMRVTMAGNVYSFGVVLLELLTGKQAVSQGTELAKWVVSNSSQQSRRERILDSHVSNASLAVKSQMLAVLKVALTCVSTSPEARPKMKSVMRMLLNAR